MAVLRSWGNAVFQSWCNINRAILDLLARGRNSLAASPRFPYLVILRAMVTVLEGIKAWNAPKTSQYRTHPFWVWTDVLFFQLIVYVALWQGVAQWMNPMPTWFQLMFSGVITPALVMRGPITHILGFKLSATLVCGGLLLILIRESYSNYQATRARSTVKDNFATRLTHGALIAISATITSKLAISFALWCMNCLRRIPA